MIRFDSDADLRDKMVYLKDAESPRLFNQKRTAASRRQDSSLYDELHSQSQFGLASYNASSLPALRAPSLLASNIALRREKLEMNLHSLSQLQAEEVVETAEQDSKKASNWEDFMDEGSRKLPKRDRASIMLQSTAA